MAIHRPSGPLSSPRAAVAAGPRSAPAARCVAAAASASSSSDSSAHHHHHAPPPAATAARLAAGALSLAAAASAGAARALARLGAAAPLGRMPSPMAAALSPDGLAVAARAAGPLAGLGVAAGLLAPADALWSCPPPPPPPPSGPPSPPPDTCSAAAMTSLASAVEGEYLAISPASSSPSSESAAPAPAPPATPKAGGGGGGAGASPPPPPPLALSFHAGAAMLPHPAKAERGGEDAYYIAPDGLSFGVADGVGGWGELGIDAGAYARELMTNCAAVAAAADPSAARSAGLDPGAILTAGHGRTRAQGSATACILALAPVDPASPDGGSGADAAAHVRAANLGDSGFLVVRGGSLTFRSPPQQHGFNFPFQLGAPGSVADSPADAELFAVGVSAGDVVVAGTDGLWDNVFPGEAADLASGAAARGDTPAGAARALAALARTRAADPRVLSPFAEAAQAMGYPYTGGKMDDITVVVAYVAEGGGGGGGEGNKKAQGGGDGGGARRRVPQQRSLL